MYFDGRQEITPLQAAQATAAGELQLVDVRLPAMVAEDPVPGAVNIPFPDLAHRLGELERGRPVAFVCRSGKSSLDAMRMARDRGYDAVSVAGGAIAWHEQVEVGR